MFSSATDSELTLWVSRHCINQGINRENFRTEEVSLKNDLKCGIFHINQDIPEDINILNLIFKDKVGSLTRMEHLMTLVGLSGIKIKKSEAFLSNESLFIKSIRELLNELRKRVHNIAFVFAQSLFSYNRRHFQLVHN